MTTILEKKERVVKARQGVDTKISGWRGEIKISFEGRSTKTVMSSVQHIGPLRVQRPFYPEVDVCHVYLLHPPGGVVGSDSLTINVQANKNSHALITTPGSTKFYLSAGENAHVDQTLAVENNCALEWFPQENIFFPGAKVKLKTLVSLEKNANFIGWEINCLGRPVNNEQFEFGEMDALFKIHREGIPLLIERQRVNQLRHLYAAAGLRAYPMNALFVCTGCDESHTELAREVIESLSFDSPVGITLIEDLLVLRVLGDRAEKIQRMMISVWQILRPLILNKQAVLPRIWAT